MPLLTIATASCNSPEWVELFVQSIRRFTTPGIYEILVIDNGSLDWNVSWLRQQGDIRLIENPVNRGHGEAMDQAVSLVCGKYVVFLDVDAHVQSYGWDSALIDLYLKDPKTRLIGCLGPEQKPLHPPLFFFETAFIRENKLSFQYQPGIEGSTDTAQKIYWDILKLGYRIERLEKGPKMYNGCIGDEIWLGGKPAIYHHWYGVRFCENTLRPKDRLDGYALTEHLENKKRLFNQPLVREILGNGDTR